MQKSKVEFTPEFFMQLKRHEGFDLEAYRCSLGALTIGWGHNCDAVPVQGVSKPGDVISRGTAEVLLDNDVKMVAKELDRLIPWWRGLDMPRQGVLLNMGFQMGVSGLMGFRKALARLEAGDWQEAARQMLDSKWAKKQTPSRAAELATQVILNEWQEG